MSNNFTINYLLHTLFQKKIGMIHKIKIIYQFYEIVAYNKYQTMLYLFSEDQFDESNWQKPIKSYEFLEKSSFRWWISSF